MRSADYVQERQRYAAELEDLLNGHQLSWAGKAAVVAAAREANYTVNKDWSQAGAQIWRVYP